MIKRTHIKLTGGAVATFIGENVKPDKKVLEALERMAELARQNSARILKDWNEERRKEP